MPLECKEHDNIPLFGGYTLCVACGKCTHNQTFRVPLRPIHNFLLAELRENYPQHFLQDRTCFFISDMWRYIFEKRVYRFSMMGETRSGKSESVQTEELWYVTIYNALYDRGHFSTVTVDKSITVAPVTFDVEYVHANEATYHYYQRDAQRANAIVFGQPHIIDESRDSPGGIGSFSEDVEIKNINNITAKNMQSEFWVTPRRFMEMNTPYGGNCYIKDEENRVNWVLFYKLEMQSDGLRSQNFLGWLRIPLHDNTEFRRLYGEKKDEWIKQEMEGTTNPRAQHRYDAVVLLSQDENITRHTIGKTGEIRFVHSVETMKFLVEEAMLERKIDNFNDTEVERIVAGIRAKAEERLRKAREDANKTTSETVCDSTTSDGTAVQSGTPDDGAEECGTQGATTIRI